MTVLLLTLCLLGDSSSLQQIRGTEMAAVTPYPTGVVLEKLPGRPGFQASGEQARRYVKETIAQTVYGDDGIPEVASPWLVLIGPDDETAQIESQIPDDLKTIVRVVRYRPDDPRLERGFKQHYPGGTYAILMDGSREITWKGLAALADIIRQINRLLGREPEPSPWDIPIPFPNPLAPGGGGSNVMLWFAGGVAIGLVLRALVIGALRAIVSTARDGLKDVIREVASQDTPKPQPTPDPPKAPNA